MEKLSFLQLVPNKSAAFNAGWESYFIDRDESDNPHDEGGEAHSDWAAGFRAARANRLISDAFGQLSEEMKRGKHGLAKNLFRQRCPQCQAIQIVFWGDFRSQKFTCPDCGAESELHRDTLEDQLFSKLTEADKSHTEEQGINDIADWDEMLECEVMHFNAQNGTDFEPKEYRFQYCERQEKRTWGA